MILRLEWTLKKDEIEECQIKMEKRFGAVDDLKKELGKQEEMILTTSSQAKEFKSMVEQAKKETKKLNG